MSVTVITLAMVMTVTDMTALQGSVVAITGASSGIGEATALHLADRGARLVLGARAEAKLAALAARLPDAAYLRVDVREREAVQALVDLAVERYGRLDAMISNAGVMPVAPLAERRVGDWEATLDVNVKGVLHGIAAALPVFTAQGRGHFVHTASTAALRVTGGMGVYSGSKLAVRAISESLRQESDGAVRVTVITPGMTRTPGATGGTGDDALAAVVREIAMPPEAVARAIAYALEQPADVEVGEIVIRPSAQR
jgi:NADP-dependent 3-hydroxy acid dehydrogenase YdfG